MKNRESAVLAFSGRILERSFPLDALSALCFAIERELVERGVAIVRRIATLAPNRFIAAPFFLNAGFEIIPADDEDVQATAAIFSALDENSPDEIVLGLGLAEPISLLRQLARRSARRVLLTTQDVSAETEANLEGTLDVRELAARVGVDWDSLEATSCQELEDVGSDFASFFSRNNEILKTAKDATARKLPAAPTAPEEAEDVYLKPDEGPSPMELDAPEWNAALEKVLLDNNFKLPAYSATERVSDRFPYLPNFFLERRDDFRRLLSPQILALEENSTTLLIHASSPELRPVSAADAVRSLTLGGGANAASGPTGTGDAGGARFESRFEPSSKEKDDAPSFDESRVYIDAKTFGELSERAALLGEQCRWSADRIFLQQNGANFDESILPRDRELESRGREKTTNLWPIRRSLEAELYSQFAGCYEVLSKTAALLERALDPKNGCGDSRFFAGVAQTAMNAQCLIKSGLRKIELNWNADGVQRAAFNLLADFGRKNKIKLANMCQEDELDIALLPQINEEYEALKAEFEEWRAIARERRAFEGKIDFHLKKLATDPSSASDWEKVVDATTALCETFREPPSSLWFRNRLIGVVDKVPENAPTTDAFARVVQEIDLFRLREEEEFLNLASQEPQTEYSPAIKAVRERYAGSNVVFIGGTPQDHLRSRLEETLGVRLIWSETDHGDSLDRFDSLLRDDETRLFLIYIPWCSHKHSEEFAACAKNANKDFVRLRKGTNPEQIARSICRQLKLAPESELFAADR